MKYLGASILPQDTMSKTKMEESKSNKSTSWYDIFCQGTVWCCGRVIALYITPLGLSKLSVFVGLHTLVLLIYTSWN